MIIFVILHRLIELVLILIFSSKRNNDNITTTDFNRRSYLFSDCLHDIMVQVYG